MHFRLVLMLLAAVWQQGELRGRVKSLGFGSDLQTVNSRSDADRSRAITA